MRVSLEQLRTQPATFGFTWSRGNSVHKGQGKGKQVLVSNKVALLKLMPNNGSDATAREVLERAAHAIGWVALSTLVDRGLTISQQTVRDALHAKEIENTEAAIMEYVVARALGVTASRTVTVTVDRTIATEGDTQYELPAQAQEAAKAHVAYLVELGISAPAALAAARKKYAQWLPAEPVPAPVAASKR